MVTKLYRTLRSTSRLGFLPEPLGSDESDNVTALPLPGPDGKGHLSCVDWSFGFGKHASGEAMFLSKSHYLRLIGQHCTGKTGNGKFKIPLRLKV